MLGAEGEGFKIAMYSLDKGRVTVATGSGSSRAVSIRSLTTPGRRQFGRPLASFQMIQDMIADISSDADAVRLLVWRAADLIRRGEPCEAAVRAANLAIQVFGGYGYVDEYPVQKFMTPQAPLACSQPTR
jgi:alkylation response protein AidB-like acyl-CoA dehydrogenase